MPQMHKWTCLRGSEWTAFVDVFFMHNMQKNSNASYTR